MTTNLRTILLTTTLFVGVGVAAAGEAEAANMNNLTKTAVQPNASQSALPRNPLAGARTPRLLSQKNNPPSNNTRWVGPAHSSARVDQPSLVKAPSDWVRPAAPEIPSRAPFTVPVRPSGQNVGPSGPVPGALGPQPLPNTNFRDLPPALVVIPPGLRDRVTAFGDPGMLQVIKDLKDMPGAQRAAADPFKGGSGGNQSSQQSDGDPCGKIGDASTGNGEDVKKGLTQVDGKGDDKGGERGYGASGSPGWASQDGWSTHASWSDGNGGTITLDRYGRGASEGFVQRWTQRDGSTMEWFASWDNYGDGRIANLLVNWIKTDANGNEAASGTKGINPAVVPDLPLPVRGGSSKGSDKKGDGDKKDDGSDKKGDGSDKKGDGDKKDDGPPKKKDSIPADDNPRPAPGSLILPSQTLRFPGSHYREPDQRNTTPHGPLVNPGREPGDPGRAPDGTVSNPPGSGGPPGSRGSQNPLTGPCGTVGVSTGSAPGTGGSRGPGGIAVDDDRLQRLLRGVRSGGGPVYRGPGGGDTVDPPRPISGQ
jgi:hypothetical protein